MLDWTWCQVNVSDLAGLVLEKGVPYQSKKIHRILTHCGIENVHTLLRHLRLNGINGIGIIGVKLIAEVLDENKKSYKAVVADEKKRCEKTTGRAKARTGRAKARI